MSTYDMLKIVNIIYTKHAEEMLVFRRIQREFVEKCIKDPDDVSPAREDKKIYLKNFGNNYLKVIVSEEGENIIVVTLHWLAKKRVLK